MSENIDNVVFVGKNLSKISNSACLHTSDELCTSLCNPVQRRQRGSNTKSKGESYKIKCHVKQTRYSENIKKQARELYKITKSTHKVGKELGIDAGTVHHWVRDIIPDNQKQKGVRKRADDRAIILFRKHGPMTYKETTRFFSDDLSKRLIEDGITEKISKKYGLNTYSVYFIKEQENIAKEKLDNVVDKLSKFYSNVSRNLPNIYTVQEKKIANFLIEKKIKFDHSELINEIKLCPDFAIPSIKDPKIIIDAKNTRTKARGNYTYMSKVMGFDALVLKKLYPNTVFIAIINGLWLPSAERRLKLAFDYIIDENNLSELIEICNKHLSG